MRYLPLILIVLAACSKPNQEAGTSDTTGTATSQPNAVQLTPEEIEQVHFAIFLRLHEYQLFSGEPGWTAHTEEYKIKDNAFTYSLVRANSFNSADESMFEDPQDVLNSRAAVPQEVEETNDEPDAEEASGDENAGVGGDYSEEADEHMSEFEVDENYVPGRENYLNELDTITGDGNFVAMLESRPEDPVKTVRCRINGNVSWNNHHYTMYGELRADPRVYPFDDIVVELGPGTIINRDMLYLKAKFALLTEKDIAGMSKEEISFLRNEIFARHGHSFQTKKMREHFEPLDWYYPRVEDAAPLLNTFEKQNVEFLKKREG